MTSAMVAMDLVFTGPPEDGGSRRMPLLLWYANHPSG